MCDKQKNIRGDQGVKKLPRYGKEPKNFQATKIE
jgi:hypothetical protein